MSSDREFEAATELVAELLGDVGYSEYELIELPSQSASEAEQDGESNGHDGSVSETAKGDDAVPDQNVRMIAVTAETGPNFNVLAWPDDRYFTVQSSYDLWRDIASYLNEDQVKQFAAEPPDDGFADDHRIRQLGPPPLEELDPDELMRRLATIEILDRISDDGRKEMIYQLSEILTRGEVKHVVNSLDRTGGVTGFVAYYKIFPYDDQFGISRLNDVIERVRMTTHQGKLFLKYAMDLNVDMTQTTGGDVPTENLGEDHRSVPEVGGQIDP
jgi:hypothetical protein